MNQVARAVDVLIFAGGIAAAAVAGVYAYQSVGPYGDGAYGAGFYRERDPQTGRSIILRDSDTAQGHVQRVFDEFFHVREVRIDTNRDGRIDAIVNVDTKRTTATIDTDNNGVIDRWEHYDPKGALIRIGGSSRGDGVEDTSTFLDANGLLAKVETDSDRDGSIDKREIFGPSADGTRRVLLIVESEFNKTASPGLRLRYRPDGSFEGSDRLRVR